MDFADADLPAFNGINSIGSGFPVTSLKSCQQRCLALHECFAYVYEEVSGDGGPGDVDARGADGVSADSVGALDGDDALEKRCRLKGMSGFLALKAPSKAKRHTAGQCKKIDLCFSP